MRINICGVEIDKYNFDEVVEKIVKHTISQGNPEYVVTPNAMHILALQKDVDFQEIYRKAFLVVPDGVSLLWAANLLQTPLNGRVNGTDLFEKLCAVAAEKGLKVFLLGGRLVLRTKLRKFLSPGIQACRLWVLTVLPTVLNLSQQN